MSAALTPVDPMQPLPAVGELGIRKRRVSCEPPRVAVLFICYFYRPPSSSIYRTMTSSDHRHNHDEAAVDETSPLLTYRAREDGRQYSASHTLNLSGSLVPEGADPHADNVHKYNSNSDSQSPSVEEHDEDADIEQQDSAQERRDKVFEGMPEIKKQMKYIMPAVAIGVFLAAADQTIIVSSYGQIGSELDALERTSWVATAFVSSKVWRGATPC